MKISELEVSKLYRVTKSKHVFDIGETVYLKSNDLLMIPDIDNEESEEYVKFDLAETELGDVVDDFVDGVFYLHPFDKGMTMKEFLLSLDEAEFEEII